MKSRFQFNQSRPSDSKSNAKNSLLPAFVLLHESVLIDAPMRFAGIFSSIRPFHPSAIRLIVTNNTDEFVGDS